MNHRPDHPHQSGNGREDSPPLADPSWDEELSGPGILFDRLYEDVRSIALGMVKKERPDHRLQATALVNEAYLRLAGRPDAPWNDRAHFLASVTTVMRRVLVDHARRRYARKRGGDRIHIALSENLESEARVDLAKLEKALTKLKVSRPRQARTLELRYLDGLTRKKTAEVLEVSEATVRNDTCFVKAWLRRELES